MVFAELKYEQHYLEIHDSLVEFLKSEFPEVESGLQGDSWIWVFRGDQKVAIDTFSSMKHEVKSEARYSEFAMEVIKFLSGRFELMEPVKPELEPHEDS